MIIHSEIYWILLEKVIAPPIICKGSASPLCYYKVNTIFQFLLFNNVAAMMTVVPIFQKGRAKVKEQSERAGGGGGGSGFPLPR